MSKPFTMNNILITRRCNLDCNYCRIIRNYYLMPYQPVEEIKETDVENWKKFGKWIKDHTDGFVIIYGGEPFVYKNLEELLKYYNDIDLAYTVITNATRREEALDLVKRGILRGLSASVDPVLYTKNKEDKSRLLKSNKGLDLLISAKKLSPNLDAVAEIVLDNTNYQYLPTLVEELTNNQIWASITIIESPKNRYYDFAEVCDTLLLNKEQRQFIKGMILGMIDKGYLIHTPEAILNVLEKGDDTQCDLCDVYHTSTIEPNGDIRLCLRIKGTSTSKHNIFVYIDQGLTPEQVNDKIVSSIEDDMHVCEGCAWTCVHMPTKSGLSSIKHN